MAFGLNNPFVSFPFLWWVYILLPNICLIAAGEHTVEDGDVTYTYGLKSDVGLLTRNIKIEGADYDDLIEESFGSRLIVGRFFQDGEMYLGKVLLTWQ